MNECPSAPCVNEPVSAVAERGGEWGPLHCLPDAHPAPSFGRRTDWAAPVPIRTFPIRKPGCLCLVRGGGQEVSTRSALSLPDVGDDSRQCGWVEGLSGRCLSPATLFSFLPAKERSQGASVIQAAAQRVLPPPRWCLQLQRPRSGKEREASASGLGGASYQNIWASLCV